LIILWDSKTWKKYRELKGHFGPIYDITIDQEGSFIASCSSDGIIKTWNQKDGFKEKQFTSIKEAFTAIAFQPNNKDILVTASTDKTLKIWQVPTISILKIIEKQKEAIRKIAFSQDGKRFVTLSFDGMVRLWVFEKLFEEKVEDPTLLSRAKEVLSGGKVTKFFENLFQTKKSSTIDNAALKKKNDELKEKMLEELPAYISVMKNGDELHIKVLQKRYNCNQKLAEEMIVRLLSEDKITGTFNPFTGVFIVGTKTDNDIIQVEDKAIEMVELNQTCFYCGEPITPEAIYCPGCHEEIATCAVCKLSIDFDNEVGVCVYCGAKGHLNHMKEAIKITGFCPVCRKAMDWDSELTVFKREPKK
jgi:WD40 repeat protein